MDEPSDRLRNDPAVADHRRPAHDRPHDASAEGPADKRADLVAVEEIFGPQREICFEIHEGKICLRADLEPAFTIVDASDHVLL